MAGSPVLQSTDLDADPDKLAKEDPLATQVWKMYARTKASLPHAQRMENLTWRMMALALKKRKEDEGNKVPETDSLLSSDPIKQKDASSMRMSDHQPEAQSESNGESSERGRRIDKGKTRVRVVGFEGINQDGIEESDVVPMDWRAISRSRSRISMDWRPASRSRSRPPDSFVALNHQSLYGYDYRFPHASLVSNDTRDGNKAKQSLENGVHGKESGSSHSIPIPGALFSSGVRKSTSTKEFNSALAGLHEEVSDVGGSPYGSVEGFRHTHALNSGHSISAFSSPTFGPSSLPSAGAHGLNRTYDSHSQEPRTFPRHVRKTSFDHTVYKDGILQGVSGRHQVNGKPLSPDSLLGQKRRAEAPHHDSMLRADPSNVDMPSVVHREQEVFERNSPFPTSSFDFTFPPYESLLSISSSSPNPSGQTDSCHREGTGSAISQVYTGTSRSPSGSSIYNAVRSPVTAGEGLSAAAAAASAIMAEEYAHISAVNVAGVDDSLLDYRHLMGLVYSGLNSSNMNRNAYTHVDPQILSVQQGENASSFHNFHPSPSSDGWANGFSSSAGESPEPGNVASSASTPPSIEVTNDGRSAGGLSTGQVHQQRKYIPLKQGPADSHKNTSS